jgi:hypothetical protein
MKNVETLAQLAKAYARWRLGKKHVREAVPTELLEHTHRVAARHGSNAVSKVIKMDWNRLSKSRGNGARFGKKSGIDLPLPAYSRIELQAPLRSENRPLAELETPAGMKVRIYSASPEALALLSSLCGSGEIK